MSMATEFMDALGRVEAESDVEPMARLFDEGAELRNPTMPTVQRGREGARRFWQAYRQTFDTIRSDFRVVIEAEEASVLEWVSRGTTADGAEVVYEGVTLIEHPAGRVTRFRAYFDPRALGTLLQRAA